MKFDDFIKNASIIGKGEEIWLTNETFNELTKQAEKIRLNENGDIELYFDRIKVQISIINKLYAEGNTYFAEVKGILKCLPYTNIKKEDMFLSPKKQPKGARIL